MTHVLPFHRLSARWMIAGMYEVQNTRLKSFNAWWPSCTSYGVPRLSDAKKGSAIRLNSGVGNESKPVVPTLLSSASASHILSLLKPSF